MKKTVITVFIIFCLLLMGIVIAVDAKTAADSDAELQASIRDELISISIAAREMLPVDDYLKFQSVPDVQKNYFLFSDIREKFRNLAKEVDVEFIYVLREVDGKYLFIFDSDETNEAVFVEYDISDVHRAAFDGVDSAGVLNVEDEYGIFNTGAVPIIKDGIVVGIVCTDMDPTLYLESQRIATRNRIISAAITFVTLVAMAFVILYLMNRLNKMQLELEHMAHYDNITGLPNRQYLMEYLREVTLTEDPFALFFIDLDNFKRVNDNAGHDAGDELLRAIAKYIETTSSDSSMAFRPSAGRLNVAARIGGDEFIQILPGISGGTEAAAKAAQLINGFHSEYFDRMTEKYQIGFSIGIALYPFHTKDYNVLIKYADIAMYHAKKSGKNSYRIYVDEMKPKDEK